MKAKYLYILPLSSLVLENSLLLTIAGDRTLSWMAMSSGSKIPFGFTSEKKIQVMVLQKTDLDLLVCILQRPPLRNTFKVRHKLAEEKVDSKSVAAEFQKQFSFMDKN